MPRTLIIGAGISGLSTAAFLEEPAYILERNEAPGGLCGSVKVDGYTFDHSGHFLHLHTGWTERFVRELLGKRLSRIERRAAVFTHGSFVPYPFQANLHALPEQVRKECLKSFLARNRTKGASKTESFDGWSRATFGDGITRHFMKPYNEKLWTVPATRLSSDWVAPFVPRPSVGEIRLGARRSPRRRFGYNACFYYPAKGGSQAFIDALARTVTGIHCGESAVRIDPRRRKVSTSRGADLDYEFLVSTQPLPELVRQMPDAPSPVKAAARRLSWNSVTCLNLGVKRAVRKPALANGCHWLYFPEKKYPFYRIGFYSNAMPSLAPRGRDSMYVEISHRPEQPLDLKETFLNTVGGLTDAGILSSSDRIEVINVLEMPYAYVIYDRRRPAAVRTILSFLEKNDIYSIGRYGAWEYSFMERSLIQGRETADKINRRAGGA